MLVGGDTPNFFLLNGMSNIDIFFIKKVNDVVGNSNSYDEFALIVLTFNNIKKDKNRYYTIDFYLRGWRMYALFLELARTVLFLFFSPRTFRLRMISSMVVLAQHGEMAKTLPVVRLVTHKLIVSVNAVVGVELLATTLACKHKATVLPNFVLAKHLQRLESLVTDITEVNPLSLVRCPPTMISSSNNMISITNLPLTPAGSGASRQAPLFMFS